MNFFKGKNALVTGGAGFIGSNLTHKLCELGANVTVIDFLIPDAGGNLFNLEGVKEKVTLVIDDMGSDKIGELLIDQDFVFNLAGQVSHISSMKNPINDLKINCESQLKFLEACRMVAKKNAKIVHTSTRQIYGSPKYLPIDEKHPLTPPDINGINKLASEQYHILYNKVYGLNTCVLRLTNTFGPRQLINHSKQGFIPWFVKQAICGEEISIFGTGLQIRDMNYVEDVVSALLSSAITEKSNGKIYNLGSQENLNLKNFVKLLIDITGKGSYKIIPFPEDQKKIDVGDTFCDYSKIESEVGWRPKVSISEGLEKMVAYYEQFKEHYL